MTLKLARYIDSTLLKATSTQNEIADLCEEAVEYGFAAVCIPPLFVPLATRLLYGSDTAVATVVGFPLGYALPEVKIFETGKAIQGGATEIDLVISLASALEGCLQEVTREIREVVAAGRGAAVKVILECCYLDDTQKADLVECAVQAGATFVKTSTGFGSGGATVEDVALLCRAAAGRLEVKAAGGIRDWGVCRTMIEAGASRIGTSSGGTIVRQWLETES